MKRMLKTLKNEKGTGNLLILLFMSAILIMFMIFAVEINLLYYHQTVAGTRADAIADSAAVYALRYDNSFSRGDVIRMTALLAATNDTNEERRLMVRPEVNNSTTPSRVTITAEVEGRTLMNRTVFIHEAVSIVEAVDPR